MYMGGSHPKPVKRRRTLVEEEEEEGGTKEEGMNDNTHTHTQLRL